MNCTAGALSLCPCFPCCPCGLTCDLKCMDSKIGLWCKCGWWSSTLTLSQSTGWWAPQACSASAEVAACPYSTAHLHVLSQSLVKASAGLTDIGGRAASTWDLVHHTREFLLWDTVFWSCQKLPECCVWPEGDPDTYWSKDVSLSFVLYSPLTMTTA